MEERGYVAEALLERLREGGVPYRLIGDAANYPDSAPPEIDLAVAEGTLPEIPRQAARFAQDFDLRLVALERPARRCWRAVFSWSDELGRPRFLAVRFFVAVAEGTSADALFLCGLVDAVERGELSLERATWMSALWQEEPAEAAARVQALWRNEAHVRLIGQAARHGNWLALRARLAELRRGLHRFSLPRWAPQRPPRVLFTGREGPQRSNLLTHLQWRLAPLGLDLSEERPGRSHAADFRVVFDGPPDLDRADAVAVARDRPVSYTLAEVEGAILRWLECRVERRYPDALVGANPLGARLLQMPAIGRLAGLLLNCRVDATLRSPVLMPIPLGIVIERGVRIGSRVTVMHQVTLGGTHIGRKEVGRMDDGGLSGCGGSLPVIEDNVYIGPGAKVLGPVRIGRGATVGANAVVTRDVPSHCTVVGMDRILGVEAPVVVARRREEEAALS